MTKAKEGLLGRGYWGRILNVDLSKGTLEYQDLPEEFYAKYLGGVGLAARILYDRIKPGIHPLGPENILGFVSGLLTDTGALFSGRFLVTGLSPQTGGWGDANCGGYFSPALKRCGVDGVFISGRAQEPVYLFLDDGEARLEPAMDLWGLDLIRAEAVLKERHGKRAQAALIGPAGENLSLMAGIGTDRGRMAARSGLGAVMGSKNLKAVVAAGRRKVATADPAALKALTRDFRERVRGGGGLQRLLGDRLLGLVGRFTRIGTIHTREPAKLWKVILSKYGTPGLTAMSAENGDSPIKNWGGVGYLDFPLSLSQQIGAEAMAARETKKYGCFSCPLRCGGVLELPGRAGQEAESHKPEYETLCAFGSLSLNNDLETILILNDMVNRAGLDSISCGAVAAFAVELLEEGIITRADTGGLDLSWGDGRSIIRLVEMIIQRRGIGDVLADGVRLAAERIGRGADRYAVHCGGVEPAMHDPKYDPGYGLAYYCEPTPGRHTITSQTYLDLWLFEKQFKRAKKISALSGRKQRFRIEDKAQGLALGSFFKMVVDCAGVCLFGTQIGARIPLGEWINAATGMGLTNDEYLVIGERVEQLRHAFNLRQGLNPLRDFKPHPRVYGDPAPEKGPAKGITLDLDGMARDFYRVMGWDEDSGTILPARLKELGLEGLGKTASGNG